MNPSNGRFATMDSFEGTTGAPASLHKYTYVSSNPENMVDPSGLAGIDDVLAAAALASIGSTLALNILTTLTAANNIATAEGRIDGYLVSGRYDAQGFGGLAGGGLDAVWDLKSQRPYFALESEIGISPLSLFGTKSFLFSPQGLSVAAGAVFGMNSPNDLRGRATSAVWHSRFLKLFGNVLASEHPANSAWSLLMTMAQKISRQFVATVGVSTGGPAFVQFGSRTSFFASLDTLGYGFRHNRSVASRN